MYFNLRLVLDMAKSGKPSPFNLKLAGHPIV